MKHRLVKLGDENPEFVKSIVSKVLNKNKEFKESIGIIYTKECSESDDLITESILVWVNEKIQSQAVENLIMHMENEMIILKGGDLLLMMIESLIKRHRFETLECYKIILDWRLE